MFPGLTELHLIGCLIELIWITRSKSNTSTPKTNFLTFWPQEVPRAMSGIICCACLTLAISVYSLLCCNGEKTSTRFRRRKGQSKIKTYDESFWEDAVVRVVFNFSEPGEAVKRYLGNKILGSPLLQKIDKGNLVKKEEVGLRPCLVFSRVEAEATTYDRSGRPDKTSWILARKVRPGHEEILLDGTAQSVTSWQIGATWWYQFSRRSKTSKFRHWKRWSRIGIVWKIKIILESGEWTNAKKTEKRECYKRWKENIVWLGDLWLWQRNQQYSWQRITKQP